MSNIVGSIGLYKPPRNTPRDLMLTLLPRLTAMSLRLRVHRCRPEQRVFDFQKKLREHWWVIRLFGGAFIFSDGFMIRIGFCCFCVFLNPVSLEAQPLDEACSTPVAQASCIKSCAALCKTDADYIQSNTAFCLEQGWFSKDPAAEGISDEPICVNLLGSSDREQQKEPIAPTNGDPCANLTDLRELANCHNARETPMCSPSPIALREQTSILLAELDAQMSEYSGLLELDTAKIEDEERLCGITFEELEAFYKSASEDPEVFKRLDGRSKKIEECSSDWEAWLANFDAGTGGDIADNLVRSVKTNMDKLRPQLQHMRVGITRLEQAEPQLLNLARLHVLICPDKPVALTTD